MSAFNRALPEEAKIVNGLSNTTPSSSTPAYASLKNYGRFTAIISARNATTVTGSAITLLQATSVSGANAKALPFTAYWANLDTSAGDTLVRTTATSNTFTTATTNNALLQYVIEVKGEDLDVANGFDCIRVGTGNATATTLTVTYILRDPRYGDATPPTAVVD